MKTPTLFKEYVWLVNTIRKAGKISFAEINEKWIRTEMSEGVELSRSTFNRHKDAIQDIFGIIIDCDFKGGYKYFISNEEVLHENSIQNWMISTLTVNGILSESISLNNRILLEPVHSNGKFLQKIIEAMKLNVRISIEYQKYTSDISRTFSFDPYCIKMFNRRWYVLGHFQRPANENEKPIKHKGLPKGYVDYYGTFSLDRIKSVTVSSEKFKMDEDFDANLFFKDCFGVVHGDGTPTQKVIIRSYGVQRYYIQDLPWHPSQQIMSHTDDYMDFEYFLRPSIDFAKLILSFGDSVKVLEPKWLAEEIHLMHMEATELYENEDYE